MRSKNNTPAETLKTTGTKLGAWPPEIDCRLREACELGVTATELAVELGRSRAAISGRMYRLGIQVCKLRRTRLAGGSVNAPPCDRQPQRPAARTSPTGARSRPFRARTILVTSTPLPLAQLGPDTCRYCVQDTPEGYMEQALFCAAAAQPGQSYCPAHRNLAALGRKLDVDALSLDLVRHLARNHV